MSDYLFAYGTLQPGLAPPGIAHAVAGLAPIGEGFVQGVLYDLGGHPGAVLGGAGARRIVGMVYQLPDDPRVIAEMDAYEDFLAAEPERSLFLRVLHPVELATGGTLQCWVYVYNRDPGDAPVIESGRFRKCSS